MTNNFAAIFFALLLFLATLKADGKRITLEDHQVGRNAVAATAEDVSANEATATRRRTNENVSDVALVASQHRVMNDSRHHFYDRLP
ncbi:hypothetical protein GQ457_09G024640 [Hibiscus cannabinus]